ncbi:DUF4383 domain-containing protein [Kocuria flava]|uniref:Uncharacterized protein n=1 Tax=Kocuria flava TaxID=446860 RepID=A0ABQ0X7Y4_9MICC|nr:DUF4383 domain-containing protein [Kocuria flava]GEO93738.1 hypothetical protein KFL01_30440 [Kocuria flava]
MISPVTGSIIVPVISVVDSDTAVSFRIRPDPHTPFFLQSRGAVYLLLWLYGLLIDKESSANFAPFNFADDWLHLFLGVTTVRLSLLRRDTTGTTASR